MPNTSEKVRIIIPSNGWDCGIALVKLGLSTINPFPKPDGESSRSFQPLRPLKALAVVIGTISISSACVATLRGSIFPEPLSETAPTEQRIGHSIGARYLRPVTTGVMVGSKASLAYLEADLRANQPVKATPVSRKLSPSEVKMLSDFTGNTLLVNFQDKSR